MSERSEYHNDRINDKSEAVSTDYSKCTITNIRRGKGERSCFIYANLRDGNGKVLINATLDYLCEKLEERLPGKPEEDDLSIL